MNEATRRIAGIWSFWGSPAEHGVGLKLAIERGWLWLHESGTYVKTTQAGADLFARPRAPDAMIAAGFAKSTLIGPGRVCTLASAVPRGCPALGGA
jgi:hypothetical protein